MKYPAKSNAVIFVIVAAAVCVCFPKNVFSKDQSAGFGAGPLSLAGETVVEKVKPAAKDNPPEVDKTAPESRKSTGQKKEQPAPSDGDNPLSSARQ